MLASITVKKKPHVGAETGMGTPFPAALGAPALPFSSATTCKRQKVAAGRHQCKSNFFAPIVVSVATCGFPPA